MELSKGVKGTAVSTDQVVEPESCWLIDLFLKANAIGVASVTVYDGHNTSGKKVLTFGVLASDSDNLAPRRPIFLEKGLFIDVGSNADTCYVMTLSAKDS